LKIAIVSDIHHRVDLFESALEFLVKRGAEVLVIAGDIVKKDVLFLASQSNLKTHIVFGNNDRHLYAYANEFNIKTEPYYFEIAGVSFKLSHYPFYMNPDADIVIFGHTHIQTVNKTHVALFLNPGEICAREKNRSECMELEILENKFIVRAFWREPNSKDWMESLYEYER
jgi:putative phosphoesterase